MNGVQSVWSSSIFVFTEVGKCSDVSMLPPVLIKIEAKKSALKGAEDVDVR